MPKVTQTIEQMIEELLNNKKVTITKIIKPKKINDKKS